MDAPQTEPLVPFYIAMERQPRRWRLLAVEAVPNKAGAFKTLAMFPWRMGRPTPHIYLEQLAHAIEAYSSGESRPYGGQAGVVEVDGSADEPHDG